MVSRCLYECPGVKISVMANDKPTATPDPIVIHGWPLSPRVFKKPEHVHDVLKRFGPQRRPALRKIAQALDMMVIDYRIARSNKPPLKFAEAHPKLERFENWLLKGEEYWNDLRPLHPTFLTQRLEMIPRNALKEEADAARATVNLAPVATTLLNIVRELRDPKKYSAALRQPHGSHERAYLWQPLLRTMERYRVKPSQHGSFMCAVKSLHLALGIDPPSEVAVRKMLYDLRQGERPRR
jgi:hypothetical protein